LNARKIDFYTGDSCHSPKFRNSPEIFHGRGVWTTRYVGHEHPAIINCKRLAFAGARMEHKSVQDNTMWDENKIEFLVSLNISLDVNF
jgi:hypothetical protein